MSIGDKLLIVAAVLSVLLCGALGVSVNVAAVPLESEISSMTIEFNDTTTLSVSDGGSYNLTANQTSILFMNASMVYMYGTHTPNTTYSYVSAIVMEAPGGDKTYLFGNGTGSITIETGGMGGTVATLTVMMDDAYNFTKNGYYDVYVEQWLLINGTVSIHDVWEFSLRHGWVDPAEVDLGMGDWVWFQMVLGFIGVIGFVGTPMVTAKLMSSKDPIVLMSAFLICMIMFGTFVYVFLLGGS